MIDTVCLINFNFISFFFFDFNNLYFSKKMLNQQKIANSTFNRLLRYYDFYFIPVVNPDGYHYSLNVNVN